MLNRKGVDVFKDGTVIKIIIVTTAKKNSGTTVFIAKNEN